MSLFDIVAYCEIETLVQMTNEQVPVHYAALQGWYDKMSEIKEIKAVNEELKKIVQANQLFQ